MGLDKGEILIGLIIFILCIILYKVGYIKGQNVETPDITNPAGTLSVNKNVAKEHQLLLSITPEFQDYIMEEKPRGTVSYAIFEVKEVDAYQNFSMR